MWSYRWRCFGQQHANTSSLLLSSEGSNISWILILHSSLSVETQSGSQGKRSLERCSPWPWSWSLPVLRPHLPSPHPRYHLPSGVSFGDSQPYKRQPNKNHSHPCGSSYRTVSLSLQNATAALYQTPPKPKLCMMELPATAPWTSLLIPQTPTTQPVALSGTVSLCPATFPWLSSTTIFFRQFRVEGCNVQRGMIFKN